MPYTHYLRLAPFWRADSIVSSPLHGNFSASVLGTPGGKGSWNQSGLSWAPIMCHPTAHMGQAAPLKGVWELARSAAGRQRRCAGLACPLAVAVLVVWPRGRGCTRSGWQRPGGEVSTFSEPRTVLPAAAPPPGAENSLSQPVSRRGFPETPQWLRAPPRFPWRPLVHSFLYPLHLKWGRLAGPAPWGP